MKDRYKPINPIRAAIERQFGVMLVSVKINFIYRFALFSSVAWSVLSMLLLYYLWTAIYHNSQGMSMSYSALITYVCLGQAFSFGRPGQRFMFMRIGQGVRSGDVIMDLVRPTDYQALQFFTSFGAFFMDMVLVAIPSFLVAFFVFGIAGPVSLEAGIAFAISLLCAYLLVCSLDFLIGILGFWTRSIWGLGYIKMAVMDILAGGIIPISLFPDWLRGIVMALPFKDMAYTPLAIYTGIIQEKAMWSSILFQLAWAIGLILFTRFLWGMGRRRIEIQGG